MRIGFYPGCSLNGTSREYNESVKAIGKALGIDYLYSSGGGTAPVDNP